MIRTMMPEDMQHSEANLLSRIKKGDQEAERILFEQFDLYRRIGMMVRQRIQASPEEQNDLVSEIVMSLLINLRKGMLDAGKGSVGTYAYGIARNKIRNYLRPSSVVKRRGEALEETHLIMEDNTLEKAETAKVLSKTIKNLSFKYQKVLMMRYYDGLAIPEIAAQLKLQKTQVYSQIHYALQLLEVELKKNE